jgi:Rps23 Pro-64 3,4-dihydroxylase Tpa1-like proline 4-hydroxylase
MIECAPCQLAPFKEVSDFIYSAQALPVESCHEILAEFKGSSQWEAAKVATLRQTSAGTNEIYGAVDISKRDAYRIRIGQIKDFDTSKTKTHLDYIQQSVIEFSSGEFGLNFSECGDAEIVRYSVGGHFTPHTDAHKDNSHRAFTVILYLNDNFTGGETCFPDQNYSFKPKAGNVLIFSSAALHASMPILSGEKNIVVFWVFFPDTQKKPART